MRLSHDRQVYMHSLRATLTTKSLLNFLTRSHVLLRILNCRMELFHFKQREFDLNDCTSHLSRNTSYYKMHETSRCHQGKRVGLLTLALHWRNVFKRFMALWFACNMNSAPSSNTFLLYTLALSMQVHYLWSDFWQILQHLTLRFAIKTVLIQFKDFRLDTKVHTEVKNVALTRWDSRESVRIGWTGCRFPIFAS